MKEPVYILIRTSRRPEFFRRMMETIKEQTYSNIVTIVYSDDPRDEYVTGDIIIHGKVYEKSIGDATYNLYCNELLQNIPDAPGWIYFLDDDDELVSPDAIERIVSCCIKDCVNVFRVARTNGKIVPEKWGEQKSFQTECFMIHTDYKNDSKWWSHRGGDHHFTKQLTRVLPINWIDTYIVCRAQTGKGYGKKLDRNGLAYNGHGSFTDKSRVNVVAMSPVTRDTFDLRQGERKIIPYPIAVELEKLGKIKITYAQYETTRRTTK